MFGGLGRKSVALAAVLCAMPGLAHADGCKLNMIAELPVTMEGSRATVPVEINHHPTVFWLDSGAFFGTMSQAKAQELELAVKPIPYMELQIEGIGGSAEAQVARVHSFGLAKNDLKDVDFLVGGSDVGNAVIGANLLAMLDTEFDLAHGSVKITDARNCHDVNLAYWAAGKQVFVAKMNPDPPGRLHEFNVMVTINGVKINAEIDTGAPTSLLSRQAAERAKIDLSGPGAVPFNGIGGFGRRSLHGWSVPVSDVGIGDEDVLNTRLDVIDGPIIRGGTDMLIGADFVMAHHIYVSRREHLIFFTYTGGRAFGATMPEPTGAKATSAARKPLPADARAVTALDEASDPTTADGFARRASVRLSTHALPAAISDYGAAIRLAPTEARYYRERGVAYAENGQLPLARTDLDKAIALDPHNGSFLATRGEVLLAMQDRAAAMADVEAAAKATAPGSLETAKVAQLLTMLGKPEQAIGLLTPVIAAHPDDGRLGSLYNGRCWARALANVELDAALEDCNRAIKRNGPQPAVLDSRGLVRYRKGDLAGAIADYDAAIKASSRQRWSLFMRGVAKAKQGDAAGAKADQDAARAIDPKIAEDVARYGLP